jgi:membrane protease YdiL (CAAX protease family)
MEKEKKFRLFDLIVVLSITILPALVKAVYLLASGLTNYTPDHLDFTFLLGFIQHALGILLLFYILFIRNRTFRDLGLSINGEDILFGIGLAIATTIIYLIFVYILYFLSPTLYKEAAQARNTGFLYDHFSIPLLLYILINPFYEELIVRGFAMTEIEALSNNKILAVVVSTFIQTSYHLYQGVPQALLISTIFLGYSIFYSKTRRLTPVIIAHLILDLAILIKIRH